MTPSGWAEFALALFVFMASHFLPRVGGLRETLIVKIGRRPFIAVYDTVSLVVLVWLTGSAIRAPAAVGLGALVCGTSAAKRRPCACGSVWRI